MTQRSQDLKVVSGGEGKSQGDFDSKGGGSERRRISRLAISHELFRLSDNGKVYSIINLSSGGMAIRVIENLDLVLFSLGRSLSGILNLRRQQKVPVHVKVKHIRANIVGCEFENLSDETILTLKRALDPEFLGAELKPLPASELATLWYHGPSGTDFFLKRGNDGQYQRLVMYVLGQFVQWEDNEGLSTGVYEDSSERGLDLGMIHYDNMLLSADSEPDSHKLDIAKKVILSSKIPKDLQSWCVRRLYGS